MFNRKPALLCLAALTLPGCSAGLISTVGPDYTAPPLPVSSKWQVTPSADNALPIAHGGQASDLLHWWAEFNDAALNRLLATAEAESASVANAYARIGQARSNLASADTAFVPTLDGNIGVKRSSYSFGGPAFIWNQYQAGVQSSWEIDLFGGLARQGEAARSQLESRNAAWHDARVAVAVEVGNAYLGYRYCEVQVQLAQADADSRRLATQLTAIAAGSGLRSTTELALTQATAADGDRLVQQNQAQCERSLKGLVALSGLEESEVRQLLAAADKTAKLPVPPPFSIDAVPAQVLLQRPDIAAAERDLAEASANIGVEQAKRYPKLSLSGNITPTLQNVNGSALMLAQTWSFGPTLSLPLFDYGKRAASVDAARAQYTAVASTFKSKVRTAVKEVEEALVRLQSAGQRLPLAQQASQAYQTRLQASQTLQQAGLGNLLEVATARRNQLTAELAVKELEQEKVSAWIALYRAAGGSWENQEQMHE